MRLIGHHETAADIGNYEPQMEAAFDLYESLGVRQVKTGYVADAGDIRRIDEHGIEKHEWHDGQFTVNHHIRVLQEAAKAQDQHQHARAGEGHGPAPHIPELAREGRRARPGIQRLGLAGEPAGARGDPAVHENARPGRWTSRPASST